MNAIGKTIPYYETTRAIYNEAEDEDYSVALWEQLYRDPLYELLLLSLRVNDSPKFVPGQLLPGEELDDSVRAMSVSPNLEAQLAKAGISDLFEEARGTIVNSTPYQNALQALVDVSVMNEYRAAIARAIIAEAMALCERQQKYAVILIDSNLRDEVIQLLESELGEKDRSIGSWMLKRILVPVASKGVMPYIEQRRGAMTDASSPFLGDIILYQGRGEPIREHIYEHILHQADPSIVLLGHSLGGIICVDLLVEKPLPMVKMLITVGSQAPFLYAINALHSLEYGETLPSHFPPTWLNIYDVRDILSYVGAQIFPERVDDMQVDSRQPFPRSHSAYWTNPATWDAIIPRLP